MKFYTVHFGQSLNNKNETLGHFRKFEDAKRAFDYKVDAVRSNFTLCGELYEEEKVSDNNVIFWYINDYTDERTDDWESVWITEERLQ